MAAAAARHLLGRRAGPSVLDVAVPGSGPVHGPPHGRAPRLGPLSLGLRGAVVARDPGVRPGGVRGVARRRADGALRLADLPDRPRAHRVAAGRLDRRSGLPRADRHPSLPRRLPARLCAPGRADVPAALDPPPSPRGRAHGGGRRAAVPAGGVAGRRRAAVSAVTAAGARAPPGGARGPRARARRRAVLVPCGSPAARPA